MVRHDPFSTGTEPRQYECQECLNRTSATEHRAVCPECSGTLRNLTVPRE
ncbi:rubrerythrin-like domain-containing protein [Halorussus halophilus]|nr:rubrerythrin-like domain-containing protein [Halorussus halophilus]